MRYKLKQILPLITLVLVVASPSLAEDNCESAYNQALAVYKTNSGLQQSDFTKWQSAQKQLLSFVTEKLQTCPNESQLYSISADLYIAFGQNDKALQMARRAVELGPAHWEANNSLSFALSLAGHNADSIMYLKKAIDLAPAENKAHLLVNLCSTYEYSKQYEQAIDACTILIETSIQHRPFGYFARGRAMSALGKQEEAIKDFSKAKELGFDGQWFYSDEHEKDGKIAPNKPPS